MQRKVYIFGACRTAIGKFGGSLADKPVVELGSIVIREALLRSDIRADDVDMVMMGCALQAGLGQNVARQATLIAGLPVEVPAMTINVVCGSGLEAVNLAAQRVKLGLADIIIAGGMENMSASPYALQKARYGYRLGSAAIIDTLVTDGLTDAIYRYHMGDTAENIAERWEISRGELDLFAARSQEKATMAIASGKFRKEIVPIEINTRKGVIPFDEDEGIRRDTTLDGLAKLKPAFKPNGVITAGNSSTINDGAAALVLVSEEKADELGLIPDYEWIDSALVGLEPEIMGMGAFVAAEKVLKSLNLTIADIDLLELNEAFASQAIAVIRELGLNSENSKVNVNGGAIALGHPIGASGCRILVTLIHEMERRKESKTGLASLCIGGGMGTAAIIRKI